MIKDPESLYLPGTRGMHWFKLKRELATLDVVVVAAELGVVPGEGLEGCEVLGADRPGRERAAVGAVRAGNAWQKPSTRRYTARHRTHLSKTHSIRPTIGLP